MTPKMQCGPCRTCAKWGGVSDPLNRKFCQFLEGWLPPDFGCVRWTKREPEITPEQARRAVELLRCGDLGGERIREIVSSHWRQMRAALLREIDGD